MQIHDQLYFFHYLHVTEMDFFKLISFQDLYRILYREYGDYASLKTLV